MQQTQTETAFDQISEGDRVEVDVESKASPFGNSQKAAFDVTEVNPDEKTIFGVDPNWSDEVELLGGGDGFHYAGGGKSGEALEIRVMETTEDDVTIHGSGEVVHKQE